VTIDFLLKSSARAFGAASTQSTVRLSPVPIPLSSVIVSPVLLRLTARRLLCILFMLSGSQEIARRRFRQPSIRGVY
jgi:hypothetical protein